METHMCWHIETEIKTTMKFNPKGPSNNIPTLVPKMTWRRQGDKPSSESVMASLQTHICVTRPQLVYEMFHWYNWWLIVLIGAYNLPKSKRNNNQLDPLLAPIPNGNQIKVRIFCTSSYFIITSDMRSIEYSLGIGNGTILWAACLGMFLR